MKRITLIICCVMVHCYSSGQILTPVKWSYAAKKTNEKEAIVFIKATIDDGWHIYSVHQPTGGPIKTKITFRRSKEYTMIGPIAEPKPLSRYEGNFKMDILYFERSVIFKQKLKINKTGAVLNGKVSFMVCNDEKCLPPEDLEFTLRL